MASLGSLKSAIFDREEKKMRYQSHIRGLNAYDRHKKFINDYVHFYGKTNNHEVVKPIKTDQDTIREGYRFILSEEEDMDSTWEKRLVKRYYDKLFKEYCIADMAHYKKGKIGLRWRTEKEVISGKGQFVCGNKQCDEKDGLGSYEVNFSYLEAGENKQALVKVVACKRCAEKLAYKRQKEKEQLEPRQKEEQPEMGKKESLPNMADKENSRRKRERDKYEESTDDEYDRRRKKGRKVSSSRSGGRIDEDENFDEFLVGMFP